MSRPVGGVPAGGVSLTSRQRGTAGETRRSRRPRRGQAEASLALLGPSVDSNESGRHGTLLGEQDIISAAGGSRVHDLEPEAGLVEGPSHGQAWKDLRSPGPDQPARELVLLGKDGLKIEARQAARITNGPGVHAARQAQD